MGLKAIGILIEVVFLLGLNSCVHTPSDTSKFDEKEYNDENEHNEEWNKSHSSIGATIVRGQYSDAENSNNFGYSDKHYDNMTADELFLLMANYYNQWEYEIEQGNFEEAKIMMDRLQIVKEEWEENADIEDFYRLLEIASN
ncbi:MAG: hypothetical protein J1F07_08820 [Muribaculaceae bacterium]|nr:hypothetical protein [Muribaculaceae bacterium]